MRLAFRLSDRIQEELSRRHAGETVRTPVDAAGECRHVGRSSSFDIPALTWIVGEPMKRYRLAASSVVT
jgi:hypothetical protein